MLTCTELGDNPCTWYDIKQSFHEEQAKNEKPAAAPKVSSSNSFSILSSSPTLFIPPRTFIRILPLLSEDVEFTTNLGCLEPPF